jgi:hypothetical protein
VAERTAWDQWMEATIPKERERIHAALLQEHGFLLHEHTIDIDYVTLAVRGSSPLTTARAPWTRRPRMRNERRTLGLFLAFMQELAYAVPPTARWTGA